MFFIYYVGQSIDGKRGRPYLLLDKDETFDIEGILAPISQCKNSCVFAVYDINLPMYGKAKSLTLNKGLGGTCHG